MSQNNLNSIREQYLGRNDIFALEFNGGLVILQVDGWESLSYEPYTQIDPIPPESSSGFSRLDDSNGDDILYMDETNTKVIHASIGQYPSDIRRYTNYPESENRLRTIPNLNVPSSTTGDSYGDIDGNDSPYENPTNAQELVIPPGVHLDFDFYNPDANKTKEPIISIDMREYNVEIIDPKKHTNVAKRVVKPGSPMPTYPVGSIDNQIKMGNLSSSWDIEPTDKDEIRRL